MGDYTSSISGVKIVILFQSIHKAMRNPVKLIAY